jgi:hypothetical protein
MNIPSPVATIVNRCPADIGVVAGDVVGVAIRT